MGGCGKDETARKDGWDVRAIYLWGKETLR